ncbi:hypothetical protein SAMN06296427_10526 [Moheibacter sediminis]|uniref:ATP-grasp domain-containing protein n=2 Tax=Moheibacter sediminis TaxID=1434700 RepID=A0A1W2ARN3_9FLAO|nr:hypothetical protein SAMN06296427_10526 [Moheibacter sediminis]
MWIFYAPFVTYWWWNSLKSNSLFYFCKVNPGIKFGGFTEYSKFDILKQISPEFVPKTDFISNKTDFKNLWEFPFVVKPDIGERGVNVEVIHSVNDWINYPSQENLIIQEFIDFPFEFGVFYAKMPNENSGEILSITGKEFLQLESDGILTLRNFIAENTRAFFRKDYLLKKFENELDIVHPKGTKILLEPVGNHNRGTMFYDASDLISEKLTQKINEISEGIDRFYYGRFDVKAKSIEDLKNGKFIILEINGANSEATHIYDPKYSLIQAYKEARRHLDIQFQIARNQPKNYSDKEFIQIILKRIF